MTTTESELKVGTNKIVIWKDYFSVYLDINNILVPIDGFVAILTNIAFLFTKIRKWSTTRASRKTSIGHFIYLMNFHLSLDTKMYPQYPHFRAF